MVIPTAEQSFDKTQNKELGAPYNPSLSSYASLIKLSHTIFAMPFALSMAFILLDKLTIVNFIAIIICLVSARTSAMAFNRYIDVDIDAKNPRTKTREIPAGIVSKKASIIMTIISSLIFLASSYMIGEHCLVLAPLVLIILLGYSLTKRFTSFSHYVLGLSLALAPGGVWYALTAKFAIEPVYMMLAVLFWVAGFDIIYALQDMEFDQQNKLFSVPAKFGQEIALKISRVSHLLCILFMTIFGKEMNLGGIYYLGVLVFGLILLLQHIKVLRTNPQKIEPLFFTHNGVASVVLFIFVVLDKILSA